MVKVGSKNRILQMEGEPLYSGKVCIDEHIDGIGKIHVSCNTAFWFWMLIFCISGGIKNGKRIRIFSSSWNHKRTSK